MDNENKTKEIALKVYDAVFGNRDQVEIRGDSFKVTKTSQLRLRVVKVGNYTFLEQNPEKDSVWGKMAHEGHKILWVLEDDDYIAQVRDGAYHSWNK